MVRPSRDTQGGAENHQDDAGASARQKQIAEDAARRAIARDDTLVLPHQVLGRLEFAAWHWDAARREFDRARNLRANQAGYEVYLLAMSKFDEALDGARRDAKENPSYFNWLALGWTAFMTRQFDESVEALLTGLAGS